MRKIPKVVALTALVATVAALLAVWPPARWFATPASPRARQAARLAFNRGTLAGDYEKVGRKDARWDAEAKQALEFFASSRAGKMLNDLDASRLTELLGTMRKAGCEDPLLEYLDVRFGPRPQNLSAGDWAALYSKAAEDLQTSGYSPLRKFYASLRASESLKATSSTNTPPEVHRFRHQAKENLLAALQNKAMPGMEAYEACRDLLAAVQHNPKQFKEFYDSLEKPLLSHWPYEATTHLLRGRYYIDYAWQARGGQYADKVTNEGWKLMAERLKVAEKELTRAWKLDPENPQIAVEMMTVELGQGQGRERLELWFKRAMKLDPNNYEACSRKLNYLAPKWYGSPEELLAFGHECVDSTQWGGSVPLILLSAHEALERYLDPPDRPKYWKRPGVWNDIQACYEKFYELNPGTKLWRQNYAWNAYRCEQWKDFARLIEKVEEPIEYEHFGGRAKFEETLKTAKAQAKD